MAEHHGGNRGGSSNHGRGEFNKGSGGPASGRNDAGARGGSGDRNQDTGERRPFTNDRNDRKPFSGRPDSGERRPFTNDRNDRGARPSFGERKSFGERRDNDRPSNDRSNGERRPFNADRGERPAFGGRPDSGERRPFNNDRNDRGARPAFGERKPFGERRDNDRGGRPDAGERRPFNNDRNDRGGRPPFGERRDNDRKPFGGRPDAGERRPFNADRNDRGARPDAGERRPFNGDRGERPAFGERKPFVERRDNDRGGRPDAGERRPYSNDRNDRGGRPDAGERRPYSNDRNDRGGRPAFGERRDNDRKPFGGRPDSGERRPFNKDSNDRNDRGARPAFGERKPFVERRDNDRPFTNDRSDRKPYGDRPGSDRKPFNDDRGPRADKGIERRDDRGADRGGWKPREDRPQRSDRPAEKRQWEDRGPREDRTPRRDDRGDHGPRTDRPAPEYKTADLRRSNRPDRERSPEIDEDVTGSELDKVTRAQLRTLDTKNNEWVSKHLVMAGRLMDDDAELAFQHALAASRRGGRLAAVREAVGLTAYAAGHYGEALREFRTYRRISGSNEHLPVMADCERGMGRPDRALDLIRSEDVETLDTAGKVELAIVTSGARTDLGELEAAVAALQIPQLDINRAFSFSPRLFRAYASALEGVGRTAEAKKWERQATVAENALGVGEDADPFIIDLGEEDEEESKPKKKVSDVLFDENGEAVAPAPVSKPVTTRNYKAELDDSEIDDAEADYFESDDAESDEDSVDEIDAADASDDADVADASAAADSAYLAEDAADDAALNADGEPEPLND